jgi:hypothetical protein
MGNVAYTRVTHSIQNDMRFTNPQKQQQQYRKEMAVYRPIIDDVMAIVTENW